MKFSFFLTISIIRESEKNVRRQNTYWDVSEGHGMITRLIVKGWKDSWTLSISSKFSAPMHPLNVKGKKIIVCHTILNDSIHSEIVFISL